MTNRLKNEEKTKIILAQKFLNLFNFIMASVFISTLDMYNQHR